MAYGQRTGSFAYHTTDLYKSDLADLFSASGKERNDIYVLTLNDDLELHLKYRKCDKYYNGGEVKVFDVVNFTTSEFLLARSGKHYFATFTRDGWHNYLIAYVDGNLMWMEEVWAGAGCGTEDKGFSSNEEMTGQLKDRSVSDFTDSLNIMFVFNQSGKIRVEQQLNIEGDTALFMWSNVAISYMNMTLENSGVPGFCRLTAIREVDYEAGSIGQALGAVSTFSGNMAPLKQVAEDNCIHITSFLTDYPGTGPSGQGILFRRNTSALSNASIISFSTLCHELGHNLGFGHGPNADNSGGFDASCRGYSTAYDGLSGENVSTLMDYATRIFTFSNTVKPYLGEYEHHHGRILGNENRNNAGSLQTTYPLLQIINSRRVFIDTIICEGNSLFGYREAGNYIDTIPDPASCSGLRIRRLNLKIRPAIESNYDERSILLNFDFAEFTDEVSNKQSVTANDDLWVYSTFHIYKFDKEQQAFEKIVSFPDPQTGGTLEGETEIILDINIIDDRIYVESNRNTYRLNEEATAWQSMGWSRLPVVADQTGTLIRIAGSAVLRSNDGGENWVDLNIPLESGNNGVLLHKIRAVDGYWFVQQYAPYHLYISKDDGLSWERSNTGFLPAIDRIFIRDGIFYIKPINMPDYYHSFDEGLNWEKEDVFKDDYERILYREADSTFFLQKANMEVYSLEIPEKRAFYLTNLDERISGMFDDYLTVVNNQVRLIHIDSVAPLEKHVSLCEGEEYFGYTETGEYLFRKSEEMSCDTVFRLTLEINPGSAYELDTVICHGEKYEDYDISGLYKDIFISESGCDSVRILNLTVLDSLQTDFEIVHDTGAEDGEIKLLSLAGGLPPYTYTWSDGTKENHLSGIAAGIYQLTITDKNDCSYYFSFEIELQSRTAETLTGSEVKIFPNPVKASSLITVLQEEGKFDKIRILDQNGREVSHRENQPARLRAPAVAGSYTIQFLKAGEIISARLIVY